MTNTNPLHAIDLDRMTGLRLKYAQTGRPLLFVKSVILFLLFCLTCTGAHAQAPAQTTRPVNIHVFWSAGCVHCKNALQYLDTLSSREPWVQVIRHEVTDKKEERDRFLAVARHFNIAQPGVPLMIIGSQHFLGYRDAATTGETLRAAALQCRVSGCAEIFALQNARMQRVPPDPARQPEKSSLHSPDAFPRQASAAQTIWLPLVGEMEWRHLSLPALTIVLAAADGFNPCAMWVLLFLLGLLAGVQNRARRFVLGGAFIIASAFVYYLIMTAWLNTLLFFGMVVWIRIAIGIVATLVGGWSLRDFFVNPESTCRVTAAPARRAVLERLKSFALSRHLLLALAGIILLAFAVNIVELLCSAGIPATYTQILALHPLPPWQHHAYIALYVLVFMLDDLLIFAGAMLTMEVLGLDGRYARWGKLLGGVVMMTIGILIIVKPEWLM